MCSARTAARVSRWPALGRLVGRQFLPLNFLILRRTGGPWEIPAAQAPGIPDEAFVRPEEGPVPTPSAGISKGSFCDTSAMYAKSTVREPKLPGPSFAPSIGSSSDVTCG